MDSDSYQDFFRIQSFENYVDALFPYFIDHLFSNSSMSVIRISFSQIPPSSPRIKHNQ